MCLTRVHEQEMAADGWRWLQQPPLRVISLLHARQVADVPLTKVYTINFASKQHFVFYIYIRSILLFSYPNPKPFFLFSKLIFSPMSYTLCTFFPVYLTSDTSFVELPCKPFFPFFFYFICVQQALPFFFFCLISYIHLPLQLTYQLRSHNFKHLTYISILRSIYTHLTSKYFTSLL